MSIARRTTRDPLTGPPNRLDVGATGMEVKAVPLESLAAKELHSQVEIYCRRWIPGRSILIGGDRGSGKTTLARSVVDQLLASGTLASDIQPLFVPIHGPDFFDGVDDESVAEGSVGTATDPQAKQQRREQAGARFALRVLTIGLHRAFVTELGWALERTAAELRAKGQTLHLRPSSEVNEIVAQLRLDLDAEVEVSSLRWVWEQLEALDKGVLGRPATVANAEYWTHQGLLEILATKSLIEGYIRVAGKVEDLKRTTLRAQLKVEASSEGSQKLANTIAGALSGSAAGAGILLQSGDSIGKSLLGALAVPVTAFLTSSLLNLATKRSVDRRDFEERKISFDKSLESLDLIFPLLVNRVLDAGRAPIFVVDELDKVLNTDERLRDLIPRLKHIVSDKAFFCFLVGRDCFEKIQGTIRAEPHGRESTFFSRRLYVNQSPSEWRDYLIGKSIPGKSLIQSIAENSASGGILFSDATDSATRGSEAAYLFRLSYFALARSRMHAGDLHKSMDSWPTIQSSISSYRVLAPIDLESLHFKNQVIYQAAVEVVLRDPQLADRIAVDTEFRQSMYDRLYQPLQEWEIGAGTTAPVPVPLPADESLLQIAVTELLSLLADPAKIAVRSAGANPQAVADLDLQNILGKPRPLVVLNFNGSWRWLVDFWGRDVPLADGSPSEVHRTSITRESGPPEQMPKAEILRIIESIQGLDSDIRASTDSYLDLNRLAVELRLLNLSPPFSNFQSAAMRYQAESGAGEVESGYASLTSDKRVIGEYYGLINQSMRAIKQSFFLAELMAKSLPGSVSPLRIYNCLLTLSDEFEFAAISASEIESILESHGADFRERGMFEADLAMAEKKPDWSIF